MGVDFARENRTAVIPGRAEREPGIQNSARLWIPGLRHPGRLLPTWTMILLNSGKPEFSGAHPGMTEAEYSLICVHGNKLMTTERFADLAIVSSKKT
jgi:hypothetical protein